MAQIIKYNEFNSIAEKTVYTAKTTGYTWYYLEMGNLSHY